SGNSVKLWVDSRIMRQLVLTVRVNDDGLFYEASDDRVHASGRIYIKPTVDGRTDVLMQTAASVSGILGLLAPKSMIRDRERDKLVSDLNDIHRLARMHVSA